MRNDGENDIFLALDFEIEPPVARHPVLPDSRQATVFFRIQRGVMEIGEEEPQLFFERLAESDWHACMVLVGLLRKAQLHGLGFFAWRLARASRAAIASLALAYGP